MTGAEELPGLRLELGSWNDLRPAAELVRRAVFIHEQGCSEESEWDELDAVSLHCVAYRGDEAVGTARLLPELRIGRMAVAMSHRRRGIASLILERLIAVAAERGARTVVLHAQVAVLDFYHRHGFVAEGEEFFEEGIAHLLMRRKLDPNVED
ncbi:MAG: GNAT family N-acetyltransferase [Burkholderiaceae bacterium]|nr:GNAT family N-acetyltransferase [Burkholderiaceae bacterium]